MGTARIIDGKGIADGLKADMKRRVDTLSRRFGRRPLLAVIMVGDDPASHVYVRNKVRAAEFIGIESMQVDLPSTTSQEALLARIRQMNDDPAVDGILVQLPLPGHISADRVIDTISISKDVDGFHIGNAGALWLGRNCTLPCTPKGIIQLIKSTGTEIEGKVAVVVGRSNIVGKPVAKLLLDANASVIMTHSRTRDLGSLTRQGDILVVAVGHRGLITADMVKPGAVVIDVGINRGSDGCLCGDVDFENVSKIAGYITPVPGGVGPMTITMLMENTIERFEARESQRLSK